MLPLIHYGFYNCLFVLVLWRGDTQEQARSLVCIVLSVSIIFYNKMAGGGGGLLRDHDLGYMKGRCIWQTEPVICICDTLSSLGLKCSLFVSWWCSPRCELFNFTLTHSRLLVKAKDLFFHGPGERGEVNLVPSAMDYMPQWCVCFPEVWLHWIWNNLKPHLNSTALAACSAIISAWSL